LVAGFGGLRDHNERLMFRPRLPSGLSRVAFSMRLRKNIVLHIEITNAEATYSLREGDRLRLVHDEQEVLVTSQKPVSLPIPRPVPLERLTQPAGREPARRQAQSGPTIASGDALGVGQDE
ncbi:MAG TPA: glycosyl hydrolase family 65 protein, partial [Yinghuangia sp.]|nr:glycosyl hydrolase family 65 protein [Yinghuangia sp.]